MTATDTGQASRMPAPQAPIGRAVIWIGLAAGTAVTVLAVLHGIRFPGLEVVLSVIVTWLLLIIVAISAAELLRRHHRAMGRHAWRHSKRGALFAGRHIGRGGKALTAKAAGRWQARRVPGHPDPEPEPHSSRRLDGEPETEADARFFDLRTSGYMGPIDQDGNAVPSPPEGKETMADTTVTDDSTGVSRARTRPRAASRMLAGGTYSAEWRSIIGQTANFEPEDDGHLLQWMAAEINGMSGYAEALTDVYETCVNSLGLDPVAMQATHDVADAAAESASAMAAARAKFAAHYAEVREFAANGGLLPFNGRWVTGDGDA
jgi:hypothetical protein